MDIFGTIEDWLKDKTKYEAVNILRKFDIPCAPVFSMKELLNDKSLRASGSIVESTAQGARQLLDRGQPDQVFRPQAEITASPLLGEHTDEVLAELGYSKDQIKAMHEPRRLINNR